VSKKGIEPGCVCWVVGDPFPENNNKIVTVLGPHNAAGENWRIEGDKNSRLWDVDKPIKWLVGNFFGSQEVNMNVQAEIYLRRIDEDDIGDEEDVFSEEPLSYEKEREYAHGR